MAVTPETAARMDGPDVCGGDAPGRVSPLVKIAAMNLPVLATLAAAGHAGYLDGFVSDPLLGGPCAFIVAWYLLALIALAWGNDDLARWLGARLTLLGMLGTLAGFVAAFGAVATAGDLETTKVAIGALTQGLSLAIYTTIVGLVCRMLLDAALRWCR